MLSLLHTLYFDGPPAGGSLEERLLDNILAFVHSVWLSPGWPVMAPVLSRLVALDPHPPESINRHVWKHSSCYIYYKL